MRAGDIAALREVTGVLLAASQARLAALRQREEGIVAQIAALDAAFRRRAAEASVEDVTLRAGVDLRWEGWAEERRRTLIMAQARLRVVMEQELEGLRRDFGRDQVVGELAESARLVTRQTVSRREMRDG